MSYEIQEQITRGYTDGGWDYVPGINCWDCGRFVGRDGWIEIERREMSDTVAAVAGQCGLCMRRGTQRP